MISDADTLNRMQSTAGVMNRFLDLPQTLSLIEQERSNNRLYVSLVQPRPTLYYEDKAMPNMPASVMSVLQSARSSSRPLMSTSETAAEQTSLAFDQVITGSAFVKINVR